MLARSDGAIALIQTMLAARAGRRTGVLDVRAEGVRTLIHFREGTLVFAEEEERSLDPGSLHERARSAVVRALSRDGQSSTFDDSPNRPRPAASFFLDLESIALEAMRALPRDGSRDAALGETMDQFVMVSGDPRELATRFDMTASERAFLEKIDGSKTMRALLGSAVAEVDVPSLLATLVLLEGVDLSLATRVVVRSKSPAEQAFLLGQAAMSEGDEATAKKCFYEALRLDPSSQAASDAKQQVRVLARRGTTPLAPFAVELEAKAEAVAKAEPTPEPAPEAEPARVVKVVRVSQEAPAPIQVLRSSLPRPPTQSSNTVLIGVVIVLGGIAVGLVASPSASTSITAAPPTPALTHHAAPAPTVSLGSPVASAETLDEPDAGSTGTVQLPTYAADHRVYVDGRLEQNGAVILTLPCGPHVIQIGSRGTPKSIAVLCGREIRLE